MGGLFIYVCVQWRYTQAPSLYEEGSFFQLTKPTKRSFYLVFIWIFAAVSYIQKHYAHKTTKQVFHTPGSFRHLSNYM